jgi:hypothetical protein
VRINLILRFRVHEFEIGELKEPLKNMAGSWADRENTW